MCGSGDVWVFRETVLTLPGASPCGKTGAMIFLTGTIAEVKEELGPAGECLGLARASVLKYEGPLYLAW